MKGGAGRGGADEGQVGGQRKLHARLPACRIPHCVASAILSAHPSMFLAHPPHRPSLCRL